jgi:hypothetical protein
MSKSSMKSQTSLVRRNSSCGIATRMPERAFSGATRSHISWNSSGAQRLDRNVVWKTTMS